MMKNIKLPCGINKTREVVYIDNAKNGIECECICPACKSPLVAKNGGQKREHHFAHLNIVECEHGYQSALHYMAKDLFLEMEYLTFVKNEKLVKYKIDSVELERKVSDIIPDILVTCDGKQFIVEIYVTHSVDDEKKEKIKSLQMSAIEIDLSKFRNETIDKEILKSELCKKENFRWIYDADLDLIAQKREIIQQFGMKLQIQLGNAIRCPILAKQKNKFARFVTADFCLHCPDCVYHRGQNFISCGRILPIVLNLETRNKLKPYVFVNENKVMFASEVKKFDTDFAKNLERAMQMQYRKFVSIGQSLYAPTVAYSAPPVNSKRNYQSRHYHSYYKRRR